MPKRIAIYTTLTDAEHAQFTDEADLESSIVARLSEVYDANGAPVAPKVLGIEVDEDED